MKILVVDDYEDIREAFKAILHVNNYEVDTAENGKEALEKIEKTQYGLMILDLFMPEMGGIELLNIVSDDYPEIKVIAITGGGDDFQSNVDHFIESSRFSGAHVALKKPVDLNQLLSEVEKLIS